MEGLAALNGLARCVVLHIVADWKLRGGYLLEIPDDDAKEKKRNERSKKDMRLEQPTLHTVSVATVIALNLSGCCPSPDRLAESSDTAYSLRILQSLHRHR